MAGVKVVIHDDVLDALANSARMRRYLRRVATAGARSAAEHSREDTGALKRSFLDSVRVLVLFGYTRATWGSPLKYSVPQEFGTMYHSGTHALRTSIDAAKAEANRGW